MNNCTFCNIITGRSTGNIVYQDEQATAFRDIHPVAPTHILIVPNDHIRSINEINVEDEQLIGHLFTIAQNLAKQEGIDKSGYRLIINNGPNANQTIFHVHLHMLRHTFATRLRDRGVPLDRIKELLGHKSMTMVLRYAKARPEQLEEAIEALNR